MAARFQVVDLHGHKPISPIRDDAAGYLRTLHLRFRNGIHAETRVYTCRAWRRPGGATPYELHWNAESVPGERLLGEFGWSVGQELEAVVEAELSRGEAVRLFVYNSDS